MTVKGGTSPACAACKHQRRKCSSDCILAPYFPASQPKTFQNAHRLFGVSNIMKTLKQIDNDDKKADAMKSIIFEADMRDRFPVHGCVEYICYLRCRLQQAEDELLYVRARLAHCHEQLLKSMDADNNYICNSDYPWNNVLGSDGNNQMIRFGSSESEAAAESVAGKALLGLDPVSRSEYNNLSSAPIFPHQRTGENFPDYDLMPNYRPSETKEASDSSSESLSQCDLRNAAACLSLTRD